MKSIWFFIKVTVRGGILFLLPFVFIIMIVEKIISILSSIITPLAAKFGIDHFAGKATIGILIALCVFIICFLGGLLMRIYIFKRINEILDEKLLKLFPAYDELKSKAPNKNKE
ncbi:hypothetical protein WMW71_10755 [Flavobacterium buctense]|uniref:DUF4282 domain-containing protein n=1 Tax=Flavobacterium buctense TaxID=1648146 RepID=A0ABU9E2E8_9FLAO|nr:hypothetical protein [Flavobacterium buctense]